MAQVLPLAQLLLMVIPDQIPLLMVLQPLVVAEVAVRFLAQRVDQAAVVLAEVVLLVVVLVRLGKVLLVVLGQMVVALLQPPLAVVVRVVLVVLVYYPPLVATAVSAGHLAAFLMQVLASLVVGAVLLIVGLQEVGLQLLVAQMGRPSLAYLLLQVRLRQRKTAAAVLVVQTTHLV